MNDDIPTLATHQNSFPFDRMARLIEKNGELAAFGGAAVIVPPNVTGTEAPIEILLLASGDPAQFLSTVLSRVQIMLKEIDDKARFQQAGFPR